PLRGPEDDGGEGRGGDPGGRGARRERADRRGPEPRGVHVRRRADGRDERVREGPGRDEGEYGRSRDERRRVGRIRSSGRICGDGDQLMWKLKRTNNCGELRASDVGKTVILNGWVDVRRDFGKLIFVDLRDRYGKTQVLFSPDRVKEVHDQASKLRGETVIAVKGKVCKRDADTINKKIATGEIEIEAAELEILNEAKTPPFEIGDRVTVGEDMRLQYRYMDLRRPAMQRNIITRHKIVQVIREYMDANGFIDIETPYMVKFTPGGARNFVCPSRLYPGKFFALAESPQIFKQLFMVSGLDKYYQIARCFRDEDLRADRQLEFTQLDVEMSFVQREDVMEALEGAVAAVWKQVAGVEVKLPFPRMTYDESELFYGTDKPDLRFGLKIFDVSGAVKNSEFKVFSEAVAKGGVVRGICAPGGGTFSRKEIEGLETY